MFVDKKPDWHLTRYSPCIDMSANRDWMTNSLDLNERTRIFYRIVDIGAYEYTWRGTIFTGR